MSSPWTTSRTMSFSSGRARRRLDPQVVRPGHDLAPGLPLERRLVRGGLRGRLGDERRGDADDHDHERELRSGHPEEPPPLDERRDPRADLRHGEAVVERAEPEQRQDERDLHDRAAARTSSRRARPRSAPPGTRSRRPRRAALRRRPRPRSRSAARRSRRAASGRSPRRRARRSRRRVRRPTRPPRRRGRRRRRTRASRPCSRDRRAPA